MQFPLIRLATGLVGENTTMISVANDYTSIITTGWGPDHIRRRIGLDSIDHDGDTIGKAEIKWTVGHSIVDGIAYSGPAISSWELVDQDILPQRGDVGNAGHSRTSSIVEVGNIVYHGSPGSQIRRFLVSKLLSMEWITLVRVEHADGMVEKSRITPFSVCKN